LENGVNLIGSIRTETGIGESCRVAANALNKARIPFGIINFKMNKITKNKDYSWVGKEMEIPIYNTNIFHVNASRISAAYKHFGDDLFHGRYNIGYWAWELQEFPDKWSENFEVVDEIWVPSTFVQEAISKKSPVPVIKIPHSVEVILPKKINRNYFNLPGERFLFLSMYDVLSLQERKNPKAVVKAFKKAFAKNNPSVGLVLKVNNGQKNPKEIKNLKKEIKGYRNIIMINEVLNRSEINGLLNSIDCFVSLHRAEGFGLGLAEAMYLGKPVIATNWSGNTDFMTNYNSFPVEYKLIKIGKDYGPYNFDQMWADPDVDHAAHYMTKIWSDRKLGKVIGLEGQKTICNYFAPTKVGKLIKNRLTSLSLIKD
jgi:glycosyltransferase involved in cell wall biosynthesis